MSLNLDDAAELIWGRLGEIDAANLQRLAEQIGYAELSARLGALSHRVARGDIDPPSATSWLARQRPARASGGS